MEHLTEYWFQKYDRDSFDRDFSKVPYMDYLSLLMVNPDFTSLPNKPPISNEIGIASFQKCLLDVHASLINYFSNFNLDEGLTDPFSRWGRLVLAFLDCEKLYFIIFWGLTYIPQFVECRVNASFIRFFKFFISFVQNLITQEGLALYSNITGDGGRRMNIVIKRLVQTNPKSGIYADWKKTLKMQQDIVTILKPLKSKTPSLISKISHFVEYMFDKSLHDLKKECDQLFGDIDRNWVKKIQNEHLHAIQHIDAYLEDQERMMIDDYKDDQDLFEQSDVLKGLMEETEKSYLPEHLKQQLYGVEGTVQKQEIEKQQKQRIVEKLKKKQNRQQQKSQELQQNYMEKLRQERELITTGTMVTQESGEGDSRPKELKNSLVDRIKQEESINKDNSNMLESRMKKFQDSDTYKNSPNNPFNMQGSVVAFLAKDVLEKFYEEQEKKRKRDEEQQARLQKQKNLQQSTIIQTDSTLSKSTAASSMNSRIPILENIVSNEKDQIQRSLNDQLVNFIQNADQSLVEIKIEDIAVDDPGKKRRYRIKKREKNVFQDSGISNSELELDLSKRQGYNKESLSSELQDEDSRRAAQQRAEQNQAFYKKLKATNIQEEPIQDVKDIELFCQRQFIFINNQNFLLKKNQMMNLKRRTKNKRELNFSDKKSQFQKMKFYHNKVISDSNKVFQGIVFDKFFEQMGDKNTNPFTKKKKQLEMFLVNPRIIQYQFSRYKEKDDNKISIKPIYDDPPLQYWYSFQRELKQSQIKQKKIPLIIMKLRSQNGDLDSEENSQRWKYQHQMTQNDFYNQMENWAAENVNQNEVVLYRFKIFAANKTLTNKFQLF